MEINALPKYDMSDNPTNCCPRFHPEGWDNQELHFKEKLFVKADTISLFHMPINMGSVFSKTLGAIEKADATGDTDFIVLSHDPSAWCAEHLFAITKEATGREMLILSGDMIFSLGNKIHYLYNCDNT